MTSSENRDQPAPLPTPARNQIGSLLALQLKKAKILPSSVLNPITATDDIARFLSDQVIEAHRGILNDSSATMKDRRLSYQAINIHFLILLALAGGVPPTEPIQPPQE